MTDSPGPDAAGEWAPRGIDTPTPSTARMYDYYLGGKHQAYQQATSVLTLRPQKQIRNLLTGFEILDPGVVPAHEWRNTAADEGTTRNLGYGVFGRKP